MSLLPIIVSPAAGRLPASTVRSMEQLPITAILTMVISPYILETCNFAIIVTL
jgi:hypothetical protein